ncbi:MAG: hypothetical protein Q8K45_07580 [Rubrivivax sp.]|nr:hypothetical protein [Rubrivivax sp.]
MYATVESCRRIDVRTFAREGLLTAGNTFAWTWWQDLKECRVEVEGNALVLRHSLALAPTAQRVPILRTDCPFGGTRPWFECPGCSRRCALLFLRPWGFVCKRCGGLAYTSEREDEIARGARARNKAAARLGAGGQRPKSMRHAKYGAIVERVQAAERRCITAMTHAIGLLARSQTAR